MCCVSNIYMIISTQELQPKLTQNLYFYVIIYMHIPMQNTKVQFFPHLGEKTSKIVLYSYKNRFWCLYLCTNQITLCKWWVMTMNSYALTDALNGTYFPLNKPTHISSFLTLTQPFWDRIYSLYFYGSNFYVMASVYLQTARTESLAI